MLGKSLSILEELTARFDGALQGVKSKRMRNGELNTVQSPPEEAIEFIKENSKYLPCNGHP